ncbi:MAG: polymer-forming cytoskeletal protein [Spirochaetaceae bacterium]|jgi:cytoskeletal protein CcmA (bactofilin family)|nr:polymer-forming cytoskeletal protein [Spirochaetaceae bacterium]
MPANKREDFSVNTIIGPNTHINGDVDSAGFTRIDGSLCGDLNATGRIIVGERARMKSNITGTAITIGGVVSGNVLASERVTILATGIVLGDIITQRIQADEGCLLHGRITVCQTREKWNSTVNEYRDIEHLRSVTAGFAPQLHSDVSGATAECSPENEIRAAETVPPETGTLAAGPEEINPAPAVLEGRTAVFAYAAALPREAAFAGEQTAPEYPGEEFPPENAAPENTSVSPDASPPEDTPVLADGIPSYEIPSEDAAVLPDWTAFTENTPVSSDKTVFTGNTPGPPEEAAFTENTPGQPEEATFTEDAPAPSPENNAAVPAEKASQEDMAVPAAPPPEAINTGENHGES